MTIISVNISMERMAYVYLSTYTTLSARFVISIPNIDNTNNVMFCIWLDLWYYWSFANPFQFERLLHCWFDKFNYISSPFPYIIGMGIFRLLIHLCQYNGVAVYSVLICKNASSDSWFGWSYAKYSQWQRECRCYEVCILEITFMQLQLSRSYWIVACWNYN